MGWIEQLPSGRHRGVIRLANGSKRGRTFDYAYEAEAWMLEAEERVADVTEDEPELPRVAGRRVHIPSVAEHGKAWLERKRGGWAYRTHENYDWHVRVIEGSAVGSMRVDVIKKTDVEEWITNMVDEEIGVPSIKGHVKILGMLLRDACANRLTGGVVATNGIRLPGSATKPPKVVSLEEELRMMAGCADEAELLAQLLLGLDAGLRWSEMAGLSVDGIDFEGRYLRIFQVVERPQTLRPFPKSHRARIVPLTDRLAEALKPLVKLARLHRGHDGLLFVTATDRPLGYDNWRRDDWRPLTRRAKLKPRPGFHTLRHTYGTRLAAAGVPRVEIAVVMGHADERTTGIYVHAGDDGRRGDLVRAALAS